MERYLKSSLKVKETSTVGSTIRICDNGSIANTDTESLYTSNTTPNISPRNSEDESCNGNSYHDYSNLVKTSENIRKKVNFSMIVRVCLIPCRKEIESIKHLLWWNSHEIDAFKKDAIFELKEFMDCHGCTLKQGMFILYQRVYLSDNSLYLQRRNDMPFDNWKTNSSIHNHNLEVIGVEPALPK
jgi:hypothetical protein